MTRHGITFGRRAGAALGLSGLAASRSAAAQPAGQLRIGLREDPDILDPTLARTFVSRMVFAALCDKLFDIDERLGIVPQLAAGHTWEDPQTLLVPLRRGVRFHDGEAMDAEAVRYSLNRHLTMPGSFRRGEIAAMDRVEVVDAHTVRIRLKEPSAPFLSQLTDRAGMIVSPRAAEAAGREFGLRPVGAGPFRFVERIAQDRIVVERFPDYWDAARVHVQRIIYQPIFDSSVRLANLQSGTIDVAEIAPSDLPAVRGNPRLSVAVSDELGYQSILFNLNNGPRADTPFGRDPRIREAFELAIDRDAINRVVFEGIQTVTAQPVPPASPFHVAEFRPEPRDVARARQLLREAGVATPLMLELNVPTNPELRQVAEVIQSMVAEAGFELRINAMEFASGLQAAVRGDIQMYLSAWSGRVDPDGNTWSFLRTGGPSNEGRYGSPDADRLLDDARTEADPAKRRGLYARLWQVALRRDRARIYLWHRKNIIGHAARLKGLRTVPDGLVRVQDLRLA